MAMFFPLFFTFFINLISDFFFKSICYECVSFRRRNPYNTDCAAAQFPETYPKLETPRRSEQ